MTLFTRKTLIVFLSLISLNVNSSELNNPEMMPKCSAVAGALTYTDDGIMFTDAYAEMKGLDTIATGDQYFGHTMYILAYLDGYSAAKKISKETMHIAFYKTCKDMVYKYAKGWQNKRNNRLKIPSS